MLALDYWTFDQGADGIQSVIRKPGCEIAAADLYKDYHAQLRERSEPVTIKTPDGSDIAISATGELPILYWHEGQLRAFGGDYEGAILLFEESLSKTGASRFGWNEYVRGTIAFLRNDLETLSAERAAMTDKVYAGKGDVNLGVLDGLITCFGRSYSQAYGDPECNKRPGTEKP